MRCLGIDPGVHMGWAVLLGDGKRRPIFSEGGMIEDHHEKSVADLISRLHRMPMAEPLIVGVESVEGYAHNRPGRSARVLTKRLHECAHLAGVVEGISLGLSLRVVRAPAMKWRKHVCGKATASDAMVKRAVTLLVEKVPVRSNAHLRDAIGAALYVLQTTTSVIQRRPLDGMGPFDYNYTRSLDRGGDF